MLLVGLVGVVVATIALVALGAAPVAADQHEPENAPTFNSSSEKVTFRIELPHTTDHYPGNHPVHSGSNGYNASIEYFAAGQEAFREFDAEDGVWIDYIELGAEWIDYSQCDVTQNTKVFGIDRGNNNEGTRIDADLVEHRRGSNLGVGGLTIRFFDWGDLSGDPPYLAPEDAIVAAQGAGSNNGPCLKMTSDPGWYRVKAYANGTIADECAEEGNPDCEPDDKRWRGVNLISNYIYICECDSEQQARQQLGPPPNEADGGSQGGGDGGSGATPTPTQAPATPTATQAPADTPTPTRATTPTATQPATQQGGNQQGGNQQAGNQQGGNQQAGNQQGGNQQGGNQGSGDAAGQVGRTTPTIAEGPGFTPIVALVAMLGAALFVHRPG